jgi:hypothetical protein
MSTMPPLYSTQWVPQICCTQLKYLSTPLYSREVLPEPFQWWSGSKGHYLILYNSLCSVWWFWCMWLQTCVGPVSVRDTTLMCRGRECARLELDNSRAHGSLSTRIFTDIPRYSRYRYWQIICNTEEYVYSEGLARLVHLSPDISGEIEK